MKNEGIDPQWGIEDWLHSVRTRISAIRRRGEQTCDLVEDCCQALWPDEPVPEDLSALMEKVEEFHDRLIEWRESAARVGADETLCWILSCYETLDLDKVPGVRVKSKWITDPKLVDKRERKAQLIIERANIHEFRFHPNTPAEEIEAADRKSVV